MISLLIIKKFSPCFDSSRYFYRINYQFKIIFLFYFYFFTKSFKQIKNLKIINKLHYSENKTYIFREF